jgi:hypothetical protein
MGNENYIQNPELQNEQIGNIRKLIFSQEGIVE